MRAPGGREPVTQGQQVSQHRAIAAHLLLPLAVSPRHNQACHQHLLVHIEATTTLIDHIHGAPPSATRTRTATAMGCPARFKFSPTCFPCGSNRPWCLQASGSNLYAGTQLQCDSDLLTLLPSLLHSTLFHPLWCAPGTWLTCITCITCVCCITVLPCASKWEIFLGRLLLPE